MKSSSSRTRPARAKSKGILPAHPGEVLADTVLRKDGGLTVSKFARHLGISRVALSRVVNGRAAVSAELAIRLAAALGGSAESWLTMQLAYELACAEKKRLPRIERLSSQASSRRVFRRGIDPLSNESIAAAAEPRARAKRTRSRKQAR